MAEATASIEVFCCYSHKDETWLRKLEIHLSLFQRQGLVSLWHDRLIAPGDDWAKTIDTHLETASVILLLVSADFLASDYCYSIEMQRALERHAANEVRVVPILVRPVDWKGAPFAHLQGIWQGFLPRTAILSC
jgi:internalin A